ILSLNGVLPAAELSLRPLAILIDRREFAFDRAHPAERLFAPSYELVERLVGRMGDGRRFTSIRALRQTGGSLVPLVHRPLDFLPICRPIVPPGIQIRSTDVPCHGLLVYQGRPPTENLTKFELDFRSDFYRDAVEQRRAVLPVADSLQRRLRKALVPVLRGEFQHLPVLAYDGAEYHFAGDSGRSGWVGVGDAHGGLKA